MTLNTYGLFNSTFIFVSLIPQIKTVNMSSSFLQSIASYYFQNYKTDFESICFVFPGRRASLFFRDHLKAFIQEPMWAPNALTINELFEQKSNWLTADNITLLFYLHDVYRTVLQKDVSFDEFLPWGEMFLSDFDDVDKYLVSPEQLFSNLASLKELDDDFSYLTEEQLEAINNFWGTFRVKRLSAHQQEFLSVWENVPAIYNQFREKLLAEGLAYQGMIYRKMAEDIKQGKLPSFPYKKIVFIGFNALTPAEKLLFDHLKNKKQADFFWDYSPWIIPREETTSLTDKMPVRGPGFFIKDNVKAYPPPTNWELPQATTAPDITLTAVATPTEQIKEVSRFLNNEYDGELKTAVILADENMLVPALHGIPEDITSINVTMGYPLKNTPAFGLIELLYNLQAHARQGSNGQVWLYHKHIMPILQHQYISSIAETESRELRKHLTDHNFIFVNSKDLQQHPLFAHIFSRVETASDLALYLGNILMQIFKLLQNQDEKVLEREFVFSLHATITRMNDLLSRQINTDIEPTTWFKLFKKLAEFQTVPFKGEPLGGLQVMGILETRAIDFDKLVILDMNEGTFPRTSAPNTFIPYALRTGFGLPTIEYQDTIFSYYFFRLIHRAKKVTLLYSTGAQGMQTGEMSRYLYQLKYQFPAHPKFTTSVEEVKLITPPVLATDKKSSVLEQLHRFTHDGNRYLSPSALSSYIECPMRFYYQKVAGIREPEDITEEADARIFGLIFHEVTEHLFTPYKGQEVPVETMKEWLKTPVILDELIKEAFKNNLSDYDKSRQQFTDLHGKNVMVFEVLKRYLRKFIEQEIKQAPVTIVDLEKKVEWNYSVCPDLTISLGGIIDRVDEKNGTIRIMDYKTGSGEAHFKEVEDLFDTTKHKKNKAVFQTLLYALILRHSENLHRPMQPGIIWVKNLFKHDYSTDVLQKDRKNKQLIYLDTVIDEFEQNLNQLIRDIYNPDIPFAQTDDPLKCTYCPYRPLCNR
ncbi:PD-(D/E)XK nuclease family protein [Marinilabiliaceae bacterium JC017]|nr:PD-(D/E)XK nuclease family protein [Marinilabiliaceae bacterium JC017]